MRFPGRDESRAETTGVAKWHAVFQESCIVRVNEVIIATEGEDAGIVELYAESDDFASQFVEILAILPPQGMLE